MGLEPSRTVLVEIGEIRRASDFEGLNAVRLTNDVTRRSALVSRLKTAGCAVDDSGSDWTNSRAGGDFDAAAIAWSPALIEGS